MRVFSSAYTFDYSWNEVSTAHWRKYCPWNTVSSHVIAVDTLSRSTDPNTGILRTERLITCRQAAPIFVTALLGGQCTTYSYEKSYVDPRKKEVHLISTNLTWSNLISVRESVSYEIDNKASEPRFERTKFTQEARITALCGGWQRMKIKIEEASIDRFRENATRGREGFEAVLRMSRRAFGENSESMVHLTVANDEA